MSVNPASNCFCELISGSLVYVSCLAEADRRVCLNIGKHPRHYRLEHLIDQRVEPQFASQRQILMILQAASKVCQLNRRAGPANTPVFFLV